MQKCLQREPLNVYVIVLTVGTPSLVTTLCILYLKIISSSLYSPDFTFYCPCNKNLLQGQKKSEMWDMQSVVTYEGVPTVRTISMAHTESTHISLFDD